MAEGTIKKLTEQGFWIHQHRDRKKTCFSTRRAVQGVSFEQLSEGQKVSYTEGQGPKGPCAENVKPV